MPQRRIEDNLVAGVPGAAYSAGGNDDILSALNDSPRTKQVSTFTVTTAATSGALSIDGVLIESATGLADEDAVAADLEDKINAEPLVNGAVVATSSTDTVVVTARTGGEGFTAAAGSNTSVAATTANAEADPLPFGRLLVTDGVSAQDGELLCALPSGSIANAIGVSLYTAKFEKAAGETGEYPPNAQVNVGRKIRVYVKPEDTVAITDSVYARHTADGALDELGGFAGSSGTGLAEVTDARWIRGSDSDGLAVLQLDLT